MSIGSDGEPDTLTSSSAPKLSCGFCFWRVSRRFLILEATAAGELSLSWAAPSSRPTATETSAGRVLDDCDGLDCLRLKMTGGSSVMMFREMDRRAEAKVISAPPSIATTIPPGTCSQRRPLVVVVAATSTGIHVSNTGGLGPKPRGRDASHPRPHRKISLRCDGTFHNSTRTLSGMIRVAQVLLLVCNRIRSFQVSSLVQSVHSRPLRITITRQ